MALPDLILSPNTGSSWPPDPLRQPEAYRGVTLRRILAYILDAWIIGMAIGLLWSIVGFLTFATMGLAAPLHLLVVPLSLALPLAYHSLLIGGPAAATLGMRCFGLKVWSALGGPPTLPQALAQTVCFYITLGFSGGVLLLIALFNPRRRALHDFLAGTVVLRKQGV